MNLDRVQLGHCLHVGMRAQEFSFDLVWLQATYTLNIQLIVGAATVGYIKMFCHNQKSLQTRDGHLSELVLWCASCV